MAEFYTNKLQEKMLYYIYGNKMYAYKNNLFYDVEILSNIIIYRQKEEKEIPEKARQILKGENYGSKKNNRK